MHRRIRAGTVGAVVLAIVFSVLSVISPSVLPAQAAATDSRPAQHQRTGPVINVVDGGDSYSAGNGGGNYFGSSPDDPNPPTAYAGPGCYRSHNNAAAQTYAWLGSTGFYINRACSSKKTSDVLPEVENLSDNLAKQTDLVIVSAGGNDSEVNFGAIAAFCILAPNAPRTVDAVLAAVPGFQGDPFMLVTVKLNGKNVKISRVCQYLLDRMVEPNGQGLSQGMLNVLTKEEQVLTALCGPNGKFPNANCLLRGYPMLVSFANRHLIGSKVHADTIDYTHAVLAPVMKLVAEKQRAMVDRLSAQYGGRFGFSDLWRQFGGSGGAHGVYAADAWLYGPRPILMESVHPNPTGQYQASLADRAEITRRGWFPSSLPKAAGKAPVNLYHLPLTLSSAKGYLLVDSSLKQYFAPGESANGVGPCENNPVRGTGWIGTAGIVHVGVRGPDQVLIICRYPRNGDILQGPSGESFIVVSGGGTKGYQKGLRSIPTAWMYTCKAAKPGVTRYLLRAEEVKSLGPVTAIAGEPGCVPQAWRNHVLVGPNNAAYFVDGSGYRHHILSTQTFYTVTQQYGPAIRLGVQVDVDAIPAGADQAEQLYPPTHYNTIIRRADGVSWVVDGAGYRHHIPYAQDDVCWRLMHGLRVSETGLSDALARSLPEANRGPCVIGPNVIVRSTSGASYTVDGANVRHWIPDTDTYAVLTKSMRVVGPWPAADVNQIPEGGREAFRLNIDNVRNSLICRSDGVCWAVDGNGWRHHIPTYADNVCWRWVNGWRVTRSGINAEQGNSLPEAGAWGCNMGGRIFVTNEGAAYWMDGNVRRWIQDPESFWAYAERGPVIRGISMAEMRPVPEGGWMPRILSPNRVKNRVVRVKDGTAYFVDGAGWWHWIPNGGTWGCITSRYPVLIWDATWEQVNSLRRENGWANCSM